VYRSIAAAIQKRGKGLASIFGSKAAICIQCAWRGHAARREAGQRGWVPGPALSTRLSQLAHEASRLLDALGAEHRQQLLLAGLPSRGGGYLSSMIKAAACLSIQTAVRGRLARRRLALRRARAAVDEDGREHRGEAGASRGFAGRGGGGGGGGGDDDDDDEEAETGESVTSEGPFFEIVVEEDGRQGAARFEENQEEMPEKEEEEKEGRQVEEGGGEGGGEGEKEGEKEGEERGDGWEVPPPEDTWAKEMGFEGVGDLGSEAKEEWMNHQRQTRIDQGDGNEGEDVRGEAGARRGGAASSNPVHSEVVSLGIDADGSSLYASAPSPRRDHQSYEVMILKSKGRRVFLCHVCGGGHMRELRQAARVLEGAGLGKIVEGGEGEGEGRGRCGLSIELQGISVDGLHRCARFLAPVSA
jgi:hypothetical protein